MKKLFVSMTIAVACMVAAAAQSGISPDSLTLEIASYDSQIEALGRKESAIQQEIENDVQTFRTTELNQRQKTLDEYRRQGFLEESDYQSELATLRTQVEAAAKERQSQKIEAHAAELDSIGAEKKALQDERNRIEQELLRANFVIRSTQVRHDQYDSKAKVFTVVVTVPQFGNDTVTVRSELQLPGGGSSLVYAQAAQEEMQKTYVADVFYRIKKADVKGSYSVYITGVDVATAQGEAVTSVRNLNQTSKTFKAGKLGVSEKSGGTVPAKKVAAAPAPEGDADAFRQVVFYLDNGLFKNKNQILALSSALSFSQKASLYEEYEKSGVQGFFLNVIPFGVGSWVQKDWVPAGIITGLDALSAILMITGIATGDEEVSASIGLLLYAGTTVFALIRPWVYANKYNETLSMSLGTKSAAVNVLPLVNPLEKEYGFIARLNW